MVQKFYGVERQKIITLAKPKPKAPKSWSHEDELQAHKGKRIIVVNGDGDDAEFTLLEADRFTLKIYHEVTQSTLTVYKHAIRGYSLITE